MAQEPRAKPLGYAPTEAVDAPPKIIADIEPVAPTAVNKDHGSADASQQLRSITAVDAIGHYRILGTLGAGGMGSIYRALDMRLEREVAIKVALEPLACDAASMLREARLLAALNHPHVVTIHEAGLHEGRAYLVMELLRGETLRARMDRAPVTPAEALKWARDILRGLSAAHNVNVIHLDIKPDNVFITNDGVVKLLDFGIAKRRRSAVQSKERIMGTIAYMAPEQLLGQPTDFRADLFSFGVLLHELIEGRHPFLRAHAPATMLALINGDYFKEGPSKDPDVDAIVRACMSREPSARPPSALHIVDQLERLLRLRTETMPRSQVAHVEIDLGNVAFQCVGVRQGHDVLVIPGLLSRFDAWAHEPEGSRFLRDLSKAGRIVLYDRAGLGASDRIADTALPFPDDEIAHVDAVLDTLGASKVVLFALGTGSPLAALYAALRPERVAGLVLYAGGACFTSADARAHLAARADGWGTNKNITLCAPSFANDPRLIQWYSSWERGVASPKTARAWMTMMSRVDVSHVLPFIAVPTLVMRRNEDRFSFAAQSDAFTRAIPGAERVVLPGEDHLPFAGAADIAPEIVRFAQRVAGVSSPVDSALATWILTDFPVGALPALLRPRFVAERDSQRLVRIDRPGLAYRVVRSQLARTASQAKAVVACSSVRTNPADIWAEAEPLFIQARLGSVVATPLAQAIIEGSAGLTLGAVASKAVDGCGTNEASSLVEVAPLVHKSFSIQLDAGPMIRIDGSIMLKDPERQLVPHFRRIHESARGCGKLMIDVRKLSQINSSGLGIFIGWVGWIQSEPEAARYRLEIHIDPKVLWQRSNLMPLAMIAPDVIEVVNAAVK